MINMKLHYFILLLLLSIGVSSVYAQTGYSVVGSAQSLSKANCYQLTPASDGKTGAVWFDKKVKLSKSFELNFMLNFGNNPNGADGLALVFQGLGQQILGGAGRGLGYATIKPSLSVEFDTNYNSEEGDISEDHVALTQNGVIDHRLNKQFAAPTPISPTKRSVKDGRNHIVRVKWNATNKLFSVDVDCVNRINQEISPIESIFDGLDTVYWGFTAATGSGNNSHTVCILPDEIRADTISACRNNIITLSAPISQNGFYEWTPNIGLDNSQIETPRLTVDSTRMYVVRYKDLCDRIQIDSTFILVKTPNLSIIGNQKACSGDIITLTPVISPAVQAKYVWSSGQKTPSIQPSVSGTYSLTINANECYISDSARVTFNPLPVSTLPPSITYNCPHNQSIILDPKVSGSDLSYSWVPIATNQSTISVDSPGIYRVKITSKDECSITQQFTVLDNCLLPQVFVPDAFTPNGDGINDILKWYSESVTNANLKLFNRWGELLFSSNESELYWDGTYQGNLCPPGLYTWHLNYQSIMLGQQQTFSSQGKVLLIK